MNRLLKVRDKGVSVTMTIRKVHPPQPSITEGNCGSTKIRYHQPPQLSILRGGEMLKSQKLYVSYLRLTFLRVEACFDGAT
jgi:hypothetical protein